jgi:transposase-like protein
MKKIVQPALGIKDIMRIFDISQPTVYRWVRDARAGKSTFPLPIGNGFKKKLLWSQDAIAAYQNAANAPTPKFETTAQLKTRKTAAMERLRKRGVNVTG